MKPIAVTLKGCPPGRALTSLAHNNELFQCSCDKDNEHILSCEPNGIDVVLKVRGVLCACSGKLDEVVLSSSFVVYLVVIIIAGNYCIFMILPYLCADPQNLGSVNHTDLYMIL